MPDAPPWLFGLTSDAFVAAARTRLGAAAAAQAPAVYRRACASLGLDEPWRAAFAVTEFDVVARATQPGPLANPTEKLSLRAEDGALLECVRVPMGRAQVSLCVSSQVGCRMACRFCETGRMGLLRSLRADEIVAQVAGAQRWFGERPRAVVFMGMGEPLDNLDQVEQAIAVLTDQRGFGYAQERLTLCTVGRVDGLRRVAAWPYRRLNLAFSLTTADEALRRELVPTSRNEPLADLQAALARCRPRRNTQIAVHYCLLPGINDRPRDARAVAAFCAPLGRTMVHVIPYNPGSAPLTRAPSDEESAAFVAALRGERLSVRRRVTKGAGVMAACGQLGEIKRRAEPRTPGGDRTSASATTIPTAQSETSAATRG